MDKIFDLTDKAREEGFASPEEYHRGFVAKVRAERFLTPWGGQICAGAPVFAFVDRGRWLAKCECGASEWVAPGHLFWCFECANTATGGKARPVEFPVDKEEIEKELLKRELVIMAGKTPIQQILSAKPKIERLGREWRWGEKVIHLQQQRAAMEVNHGVFNSTDERDGGFMVGGESEHIPEG